MRHDALGRRELPVPNPGRFRLVESLSEDSRFTGCKADSSVFFSPFTEVAPSWEHRFVAGGTVHPYRAKHRKMTECAA